MSRGELQAAQQYYAAKALQHAYRQHLRVRTVGERLLQALPPEERSAKPHPYAGLVLDELTPARGRAFAIPGVSETTRLGPIPPEGGGRAPRTGTGQRRLRGSVIVGVGPGSPADEAGLRGGDLLLRVGGRATPNPLAAALALQKLAPHETVRLDLEREGARLRLPFALGEKPLPVGFQVAEGSEINAFASPGAVTVTSGMLRFVQSDDELAVVLGHELAHLTRGHLAKRLTPFVLAEIAGAQVAGAAEIVLPGAGQVLGGITGAGIHAPFSQDFEREADEVGLRYVQRAGYRVEAGIEFWDRFATELPGSLAQGFFSTHPTSPERFLHLKKAVGRLQAERP